MYTDFIRTAYQAGSEFVTLADLTQRIAALEKATLSYGMVDADTMSVTVGSAGSLGAFALDLEGQKIKSVASWYAYDEDSVFLPTGGGTFTVDLGSTADDVTHITALPSRAALLSTSGDGRNLAFSAMGEGLVVVDLAQLRNQVVKVTGATITSLAGERLELTLSGPGQHDVSVQMVAPSLPPEVVQSVAFSADSGASNSDFITQVAAQTISGTLSAALAAGDVVKVSLDDGATWRVATSGAGSTTFSLDGVSLPDGGILKAWVENSAGASSALTQAYVLDLSPPAQVVSIISMTKDSGSPGDFVTNDGSVGRDVSGSVSATLATDETLQVSFDGGDTWVAASVSGSSWTATNSTAHDTDWTIQAQVIDLAGNVGSVASQVVSLVNGNPNPGPVFSIFRDGVSSNEAAVSYAGPVAYLQYQYLGTAGAEVVNGTGGNDFINLLGGDDAANGGASDDVLDGGTGSNFLVGGGGFDVFFLDGRGGQTTWSTVTDWETGEQISVWGWRPGVSRATWVDVAGADGFQGVTLHADLDGNGVIDTSVTWTGLTRAQLPGSFEFDGLLWFK
jgi:RTX calcium-binding nonapeptide repeat (4 copies)